MNLKTYVNGRRARRRRELEPDVWHHVVVTRRASLGERVAQRRVRRERAAWERVTARMRRRDGSPVLQGEELRWRELSAATWWLLIRWRPRQFAQLLRVDFRRWAVMPGDRFITPARLVVGEVLEVKRDHVDLLVTPDEYRIRRDDGTLHPLTPRPHVERVARDLPGWWPESAIW